MNVVMQSIDHHVDDHFAGQFGRISYCSKVCDTHTHTHQLLTLCIFNQASMAHTEELFRCVSWRGWGGGVISRFA